MIKFGLILLSSTAIYSLPFHEGIEAFDASREKNLDLEIVGFEPKNLQESFLSESFFSPDQVNPPPTKINSASLNRSLDKNLNLETAGFEPKNLQTPGKNEQFTFPEPVLALPKKNAGVAAALSMFIPGLGHVYLGDLKTSGSLFGTCATAGALTFVDGASTEFKITTLVTRTNTQSYGIYAAYRDARNMNGQSNYSYKMPNDSFKDLITAPFRPSVLMKTEVWGGLLGAFSLAAGVTYFALPSDATIQFSLSSSNTIFPLAAIPIGIGEESLFRGYLQSQLCEYMPPAAGIAISSLAFGAMHIPNALILPEQDRMRYYTISLPFITTLGAYFGWITHKNHSLKESVALHAWYDFVVFAASSTMSKAAIDTPAVFHYSTSF